MLLLVFAPQPAAPQPGYANLALAVSELWPPLNATGPNDAVNWTEAELFEWMDEAVKRLARKCGPFVVRDTTLATVIGQGPYSLPADHIATLQLDLNGRTLRARNIQELEALDADWPDTDSSADDPPAAFIIDTQGFDQVRIYPKPYAVETIGLVMRQLPVDVSASAAILAVSPVMREYFSFHALAEARSKESLASMDEIVGWLRGIEGMYESAAMELWGA